MKRIILASNSPRRKELLAGLGIPFEVRVMEGIDESYPLDLPTLQTAEYIACKKACAYRQTMGKDELVITADTIVVVDNVVLGKPKDEADARRMLHLLSGRTHQVVTGVAMTTQSEQQRFSVQTDVTFKVLTDEEIDYYVETCHPMDKAGAYGIQGRGCVLIKGISGDYFNVVGLPVARTVREINKILKNG